MTLVTFGISSLRGSLRLQNSRIFCERERRSIFERKVWSEDHAYGASRLPKTTVLQSRVHYFRGVVIFWGAKNAT